MNTINVENCKTLSIGRRGENEVTTVAFDFTEWQAEFGSGVVDLYVKRFGDDSAYPVVLTIDGTVASWLVTETDTNVAGYGKAEYVYRVDGKIAKSAVFLTCVMEDIGQPTSTPPDPYESWLEQLTALGAETQANAQAAQTAQANAESFAAAASGAEAAAETAQGKAEDAQDAAEAAQATAESAKAGALAAQGAAETAQGKAEDAQAAAEQAAQDAHVEYEQLSGEVDDLSDEVADQKSAIEDLQDLTNRKAGMLVDTVSGAIASFVPDSTIPDLLGVTVDIEPVQDLHGYDSPWPAGGGKNKLSYPYAFTTKTVNGCTITVDQNGILMFSGTATDAILAYIKDRGATAGNARLFLEEGSYIVNGCPPGGSGSTYRVTVINSSGSGVASDQGTGATFTVPSGGGYYGIQIFIASGYDTNSLVIKPMIRLATDTDATFAPYENICPISGWNSLEVEAAGINLLDTSKIASVATQLGERNGVEIAKAGTFTISAQTHTSTSYIYANVKRSDGTFGGTAYIATNSGANSVTMSVNTGETLVVYDAARERTVAVSKAVFDSCEIQCSTSTASTYHPYAGNRYTIQLGQTVYGGTLDVTNGTLTVDRAMVDLGTLSWERINDKYFRAFRALNNGKVVPNGVVANLICSQYTAVTGYSIAVDIAPDKSVGTEDSTPPSVRIKDTDYTDAATFKTAMSGVQLCYELATPITIQLDPVQIATIANQTNNVWADAGGVSVEFAADIKAYIDRMNQPTEDDMIANSLIAANKYFTVNNRLFLSTASIAAGAMIIPGTNCQETSLAAALNAINA